MCYDVYYGYIHLLRSEASTDSLPPPHHPTNQDCVWQRHHTDRLLRMSVIACLSRYLCRLVQGRGCGKPPRTFCSGRSETMTAVMRSNTFFFFVFVHPVRKRHAEYKMATGKEGLRESFIIG